MKQNFKTLERVQRRASKVVKDMKNVPYAERLRRLKMIKIEDRAKKGDLIETYKIITGKLNMDPNKFFKKDHATITRRHYLKLTKQRSNRLLRNKFFSRRVVDD